MSTPPGQPPQTASAMPVSEKVKERALKRMQMLVKGNGIKPEDVKMAECDAKLLSFPARAMVRLVTSVTTRTEPGQHAGGEMIGSPAAFENALQGMVADIRKDASKRAIILDAITARPDKGFGAKEQQIAFDKLSRDFVSQEACGNCGQKGKITCSKCGGQRYTICNTCHGRQNILCPQCRGSGHIRHGSDRTGGPCPRCRGKTRILCPACQAKGQIPCSSCKASGEMQCGKCSGTGWLSHLAHVTLQGHLHFNFERQGMPAEFSKKIDAFGARHAEKKDLDIRVLSYDEHHNYGNDILPIDYEVHAPFGTMTFSLKGKPVQATLFGWRGSLLRTSDFLDELTVKGQQLLETAAAARGDVGDQLRQAARYRLLRDIIILAAAKRERRAALFNLQNKYPVGISSDKLLQLFMQAMHATSVITKKPRWLGLIAGLVIFLVIEFFYFSNILRPQLDENLRAAYDIGQVLLGGLLGWAGSYFMARHAVLTALKGLASPTTLKRNMPKTDRLAWLGFAVAAALVASFYFLQSK